MINILYELLLYGVPIFIVALIISPVQFVKINRQNSNKLGYKDIIIQNYRSKGLKVFYSGGISYAVSIAVSVLVYPFALVIHKLYHIEYVFLSGLYLTLISSFLETAMSFIFVAKNILESKFINKKNVNPFSIFIPLFFRNSIIWASFSMIDVYIDSGLIEVKNAFFLTNFLGIISVYLSLPFDVYFSRKYGNEWYNIKKFYEELKCFGIYNMFKGLLCRIIMVCIYNMVLVFIAYIKQIY